MKLLIHLVKYLVYRKEWILIDVVWKRKKLPLYLSDNREGGVKTSVPRVQKLPKYMWGDESFLADYCSCESRKIVRSPERQKGIYHHR